MSLFHHLASTASHFSFLVWALGVSAKKPLCSPRSGRCTPMLSPYSFRILALPLGGSVHLEFIWATGLSKASILQLLCEDTQLAQLRARRTILPHPVDVTPVSRINSRDACRGVSGPCLSLCLVPAPHCHHCSFLASPKSGDSSLPTRFFHITVLRWVPGISM